MICVMCPSRDRPDRLVKACTSMLATSGALTTQMVVYVDRDQEGVYRDALKDFDPAIDRYDRGNIAHEVVADSRITVLIGERIGSVAASNRITHHYRDPFTIYGMIPDDAEFATLDWDRYITPLLDTPKPHVVAAAHDKGDYVNFPFVNRAWIEAVGFYYYPKNFHHCCDTIVEVLAECADVITYADPKTFAMRHELLPSMNGDRKGDDLYNMLSWLVGERRLMVQAIRRAVAES